MGQGQRQVAEALQQQHEMLAADKQAAVQARASSLACQLRLLLDMNESQNALQ